MTSYKAIKERAEALEPESDDATAAGYRVLPHNIEAEQGLLGALLVDNRPLERIVDFLKPEHFYAPAHQRIYDAILILTDRGQTPTPVTLKNYFENDEDLTHVGGTQYLAELAASVISVANVPDYARTIYDLFLRRELITLGEDIVNDSFSHTIDRNAILMIEETENRLFNLAESGEIRGGFTTLRDSVLTAIELAQKAYKTQGHITGVTTGLRDIDQKLGGLHPSDLLILAGRPSMGKTALVTNIAFNAAQKYAETGGKEGAIVGFFSLEMSADQLATRILSDKSGISSDAIRKGQIKDNDFRHFVEASQQLSQIPLHIDDTPAQSIAAIRTRARRLKRKSGLGLLVIDYLQLLHGTGAKQGRDNRVIEISEITRGLKAIAKDLGIPVIALSQLSRAVEQREDKRPQLSDLRESGSIEQDSDVVMFVYREQYYLERSEPTQRPDENDEKYFERMERWQKRCSEVHNVAEVIVAKQRHGPIGIERLHFEPNLTRFSDLDRTHSEYRED
jgi:replicative DNA helicase